MFTSTLQSFDMVLLNFYDLLCWDIAAWLIVCLICFTKCCEGFDRRSLGDSVNGFFLCVSYVLGKNFLCLCYVIVEVSSGCCQVGQDPDANAKATPIFATPQYVPTELSENGSQSSLSLMSLIESHRAPWTSCSPPYNQNCHPHTRR